VKNGFRGVLLSLSVGLLLALLATAVIWHRLVLSPGLDAVVADHLRARVELIARQLERLPTAERAALLEELARAGGLELCLVPPEGGPRGPGCGPLSPLLGAPRPPAGAVALHDWAPQRGGAVRGLVGGGVLLAADAAPVPDRYAILSLLALLTAGGVGAGLFMTGFAARLANRDLELLLTHTQALARGEDRGPLELPANVELEGIAGSIQHLGRALQTTVRELAAERDHFQAVLLAMSEGVMAIDAAGRVRLLNPAATALLGLPAEMVGRRLVEEVDIDELDEMLEDLAEEESATAEFVRKMTGEPRRLLISGTARDDGGCVLVVHDMTEIRRLESLRRDFVANVSHELRTPVAVVQASAEALQDGAIDDPEYAQHFLDAILRNAARLAALINDLLSLSRVEEGRYKFLFADIDLQVAIDRVVAALSPRLTTRAHALALLVQPGLRVRADASALDQVLVNLLENAMKYTPEGGHLEVRALEVDDDQALIEVIDDGPGIDEVHRPRLFERFYRVDAGRSREVGGTGLGLAIVKHLVEAMSGGLGMTPNRPRGSVFWVRLPLVRLQAAPPQPEDDIDDGR
jgi:two-component system phosphate regulon sensor histidine kinase PhoR